MALITINGVSIDPLAERQVRGRSVQPAADASSSDYILIQTREPLTAEQRSELEELGVTIYEYVPEDTYLAGYPGSDLTAIRALAFVTWADVYRREFKVGPDLVSPSAGRVGLRSPSRKLRQVDVVFHEDTDPHRNGCADRSANGQAGCRRRPPARAQGPPDGGGGRAARPLGHRCGTSHRAGARAPAVQ